MPLVGLIDPSHGERAEHNDGRYPVWLPIGEVLDTAATASPKWSPWTYELIASAIAEWQERDYISTTMLVGGCARSAVIERREDYVLSLDSLYASLRGTQIHRTLEGTSRPGSVAEARFFTTQYVSGFGDVQVSCSPDLITPDGTLWDYKVTENPPTFGYPFKKHTLQLQFNRYIVNHAEKWTMGGEAFDIPLNPRTMDFTHLAIVYLGPKGPKVIECMASREVVTPNNRTIKRKMPDIWSDEKVEAEFMPRLEAMVRALAAYPEWPDGVEDVWGGKPGWKCPGPPLCYLPNCAAKRWPDGLVW